MERALTACGNAGASGSGPFGKYPQYSGWCAAGTAIKTLDTGPAALRAGSPFWGCGMTWRTSGALAEAGSASARQPSVGCTALPTEKSTRAARCGVRIRSTGMAAAIRFHASSAGRLTGAGTRSARAKAGNSGSGCRVRRQSLTARATTARSTGAATGIRFHASSASPLAGAGVRRRSEKAGNPGSEFRAKRRPLTAGAIQRSVTAAASGSASAGGGGENASGFKAGGIIRSPTVNLAVISE